jgi:N-acetyl-1-D-myo-inositol-2-amino-2-deoxy-alpha-D-glucopyranoside deacetylase
MSAAPQEPRPQAARRLLLVHAHPDDETLTTGGTIARYAAQPDTSVTLVTATLGERGEIVPLRLALLAAEHADQLGGYRICELRAACEALGVTEHHFLGGPGRWRDSGMELADGRRTGQPGPSIMAKAPDELHPRAFARPQAMAEQVLALRAVLDDVRPQVVITYDARGGYGHPDHVRAHQITMAAAAECESVRKVFWTALPGSDLDAGLAELAGASGLPFRMPRPGELPTVGDDVVTTRIDVSAQLPAKVAAMRAHETQLTVWSDGGHTAYALSNGIALPVLGTESYTLAGSRTDPAGSVQPVEPEDDLFAGIGR